MNVMPPVERQRAGLYEENGDVSAERGLNLRDQLRVLHRRWPTMVAAGAVLAGLVFAFTYFKTPVYTSTALVMISPQRERVVNNSSEVLSELSPDASVMDSEIEVLRSRALAYRVIDELKLEKNPVWNPALSTPAIVDQIHAVLSAPADAVRNMLAPRVKDARSGADVDPVREAVADTLMKSIKAQRRRLSYVIEVSASASNPREAAAVANKLVDVYQASQLDARFDAAQRANVWLSERLTALQSEVQQKEAAVETYRAENGLVSANGSSLAEQQASDLQSSVMQARTDLAEKTARYRQVQDLVARGGSPDSIASVMNSDTIRLLKQQESAASQKLAELEGRYGDLHPAVQKARTEHDDTLKQIDSEIKRIVVSLRNEMDVARTRLGSLEGSAASVKGELLSNNQSLIHLRELEREAAATRAVYEGFLKRFQEVSDQGSLKTSDARVVSQGVIPKRPTSPILTQSLMVALFFGALFGLAVGFLLEALDDAMTSSDEVLSKVGAPALSVVPAVTESQMRRLSPDNRSPTGYLADNPMSGFAEAFRVLRTTIMYSDVDRPPRVVAVTSPAPGEGKTTTSVCLARITASSGQRVLLIDCDLRRRSLDQFIRGVPEKGLLQALIGEAHWRDLLKQDIDSAVHILPVAPSSFTPRDVFGSDAMRQLLAEAAAAYDLVICDCAPVLAVAETRVLTRAADTTIVVARSGKTPARAVRGAVRQLRESGSTIAGVVLNGLDPRSAASNSYYDTPYYGKAYQRYYAS